MKLKTMLFFVGCTIPCMAYTPDIRWCIYHRMAMGYEEEYQLGEPSPVGYEPALVEERLAGSCDHSCGKDERKYH